MRLRLEDVDVTRASSTHVEGAIRDLQWLGIDWDGAPRLQSLGVDRMRQAAERLLDAGLAYPCVCSRKDLLAAGARTGPGGEQVYPGTCRGRFSSLQQAEKRTGRPAGLRFRVPAGIVQFDDAVFGRQQFDVEAEVGDFLILRRNRTPAYQLAVVVDDHLDGVTQVVRGADLLPSTARQILLLEALEYPIPSYAHVPLVCDASGRRLAKRDDDLGLVQLRESGTPAERIVRWAAMTARQRPQDIEPFRAASVIPHFDLSRVPREATLIDGNALLGAPPSGRETN